MNIFLHHLSACVAFVLYALLMSGCAMSPTQNFFGSFFPSWLYCMFFAVLATLLLHRVFVFIKIDAYLRPRMPVYMAIALCFVFLFWLMFFAN